jgi:hypothetical protein
MQIPMTETIGRRVMIFCVNFPKNLFITNPKTIGIITIFIMETNIATVSTLTVVLKRRYVIKGVRIGARNVFMLVMLTDKATSPLER